jgi:YggT family protein
MSAGAGVVNGIISFYSFCILAYVLMSWFRPTGVLYDIYKILSQICEPYVGIFRRILPSTGGIDFSPLVAMLVLEYLIRPGLVTLLRIAGL